MTCRTAVNIEEALYLTMTGLGIPFLGSDLYTAG